MIKKLLYINIIFAITLNWFSRNPDFISYGFSYLGLLPKQAFAIVEVLSILIFLIILPKIRKQKEFVYSFIIIVLILLFYLPYTFIKGGELVHYILGVRNYFSWLPILFGGFYLSYKNEPIKPFVTLILILGLVQLPVTIFQYLFSFSFIVRGTIYDVVAGTMGGIAGNLLAIILTSIALFVIYFYLKYKKTWYLIALIALLIPTVLSEAKGVYILLILGIMYILVFGSITIAKRFTVVFWGSFLMLILVFAYINFVDFDRNVWDPSYYLEYEVSKNSRVDGRVARHTSMVITNDAITKEPLGVLVGVGFGNASINNLFGQNGSYYSFYHILHFWDRYLTETGYLGVLFLLGMIIKCIFMMKYLEKKSPNKYISTLAGAMGSVLFICILAGFYTDHLNRVQYTYPLTLVLGYLIGEYSKIKSSQNKFINA